MTWTIDFDKKAKKKFIKLDKSIREQINKFILKLLKCNDPYKYGKPLSGNLFSLYRFRIGDYRLICDVNKSVLTILVINVGHRREIYQEH